MVVDYMAVGIVQHLRAAMATQRRDDVRVNAADQLPRDKSVPEHVLLEALAELCFELGVSGQLKAASVVGIKSSHFTCSAVRGWFSSTSPTLMETAHGARSGNG
ncbi:MAG TPA: hypothetical protein VHC22_16220, partial [Pirellulales bacterium]|nr:hypothetical protein [Pirellulales bacterium]